MKSILPLNPPPKGDLIGILIYGILRSQAPPRRGRQNDRSDQNDRSAQNDRSVYGILSRQVGIRMTEVLRMTKVLRMTDGCV